MLLFAITAPNICSLHTSIGRAQGWLEGKADFKSYAAGTWLYTKGFSINAVKVDSDDNETFDVARPTKNGVFPFTETCSQAMYAVFMRKGYVVEIFECEDDSMRDKGFFRVKFPDGREETHHMSKLGQLFDELTDY